MNVPSSQAVGRAIRALRERGRQSIPQVARTSAISPTELIAIEAGRGRPSIAMLHRIARSLGSTLVELVNDAKAPVRANAAAPSGRPSMGLAEIARAIADLPSALGSKVDAAESATVVHAMEVTGHNQSAAARLLGMERKAFVRRLARTKRKKRR